MAFNNRSLLNIVKSNASEDKEIDEEQFDREFELELQALRTANLLVCTDMSGGFSKISASCLLRVEHVFEAKSMMQKRILSMFAENPKQFFIIRNEQRGKSSITQSEIVDWLLLPFMIVPICVLGNNINLCAQNTESMENNFKKEGLQVKIFQLNSVTKRSIDEITTYIDSCLLELQTSGKITKPRPVINTLANPDQMQRIIQILMHICLKAAQGLPVRYGVIWDEADVTYPKNRDFTVTIQETSYCLRNFMCENNTLHRIGFVTATEGNLFSFPECATAQNHPIPSKQSDQYYRAIHHPEANIHYLPPNSYKKKVKTNERFLEVLHANKEHFMNEIQLPNGEKGFRKTILHAEHKIVDMEILAIQLNKEGANAVTYNRGKLIIYEPNKTPITYKTSNSKVPIVFNELLFYIVKYHKLESRPLFVVGCRQIDRGTSYHYAPQWFIKQERREFNFQFLREGNRDANGVYETDGKEANIFTDLFSGSIKNKATAKQVDGRINGIIAHCGEYVSLHWWIDETSAIDVVHRSDVTDEMNRQPAYMTVSEAHKFALENTPVRVRDSVPKEKDPRSRPCIILLLDDLKGNPDSLFAKWSEKDENLKQYKKGFKIRVWNYKDTPAGLAKAQKHQVHKILKEMHSFAHSIATNLKRPEVSFLNENFVICFRLYKSKQILFFPWAGCPDLQC
jgi:hypothetical protein